MRIIDVIASPAFGGFYNDDQAAIKSGAARDGSFYVGVARTPGFPAVRVPAAAVAVGLVLSDGSAAWGDAMNVQYCGVAGREERLDAVRLTSEIRSTVAPLLRGLDLDSYRAVDRRLFGPGGALEATPLSLKYGLSQALLSGAAAASRCTVTELVVREYELPLVARAVPIYCQSGDNRYDNVDKMILRGVDVLPHGLLNNTGLIGSDGGALLQYVGWVRDRIRSHGAQGYVPRLHFDVYGCIGDIFQLDLERMAQYLLKVEQAAAPFSLQLEAVADFGSLAAQVAGFAALRRRLREKNSRLRLVADEWCNTLQDFDAFIAADAVDVIQIKMPDMGTLSDTIEGVLRCQRAGVGAYLGGSCTETDVSARLSAQIGLAAQVDMILAKPGMGVDEGYMIVANEQARVLAQLAARRDGSGSPQGSGGARPGFTAAAPA
jgi:methylaspartate ammonia-lyase